MNLEDIIVHCNTHYHTHRIVCVEVNVEKTKSPFEQLILHRSLDVLIGIHGAQVSWSYVFGFYRLISFRLS